MEDLKSIKLVLNLLNILYSSYADNEAFQENIFKFIKNLKKKDEEDRVYCLQNLIMHTVAACKMQAAFSLWVKNDFR